MIFLLIKIVSAPIALVFVATIPFVIGIAIGKKPFLIAFGTVLFLLAMANVFFHNLIVNPLIYKHGQEAIATIEKCYSTSGRRGGFTKNYQITIQTFEGEFFETSFAENDFLTYPISKRGEFGFSEDLQLRLKYMAQDPNYFVILEDKEAQYTNSNYICQ